MQEEVAISFHFYEFNTLTWKICLPLIKHGFFSILHIRAQRFVCETSNLIAKEFIKVQVSDHVNSLGGELKLDRPSQSQSEQHDNTPLSSKRETWRWRHLKSFSQLMISMDSCHERFFVCAPYLFNARNSETLRQEKTCSQIFKLSV